MTSEPCLCRPPSSPSPPLAHSLSPPSPSTPSVAQWSKRRTQYVAFLISLEGVLERRRDVLQRYLWPVATLVAARVAPRLMANRSFVPRSVRSQPHDSGVSSLTRPDREREGRSSRHDNVR